MKSAYEFRAIARDALRGNWLVALLISFVFGQLTYVFSSCCLVFCFFFLGVLELGRAQFNLHLIDRKGAKFSDLFSQFDCMGKGFMMSLLRSIYVLLWSLLLIVPGIIKSYSYAMTPYILLEHPEYSAKRAIAESSVLMEGNKARYFRLRLSFIVWGLLSLSPVIVSLILYKNNIKNAALLWALTILSFFFSSLFNTYLQPAIAAFYRDISEEQKKQKRQNKRRKSPTKI